jgi:DNA-directed RNA polymerase subunit beta'
LALFDVVGAIRISVASPDTIREWSHGEVKKPETIDRRTFKPVPEGLFCERIFGPTKDWECYCGKYKTKEHERTICENCSVEVTRARVRRRRMGHIELAAPICHTWYLKGAPRPIAQLLGIPSKALEQVIYFTSYIVTKVDSQRITDRADDIRGIIESYIGEEREALEQWKVQRREQFEAWRENPVGDPEDLMEPVPDDLDGGEPAGTGEGAEEGAEPEVADEAKIAQKERDLEESFAVEAEALQERFEQLRKSLQTLLELKEKQLIREVEYRGLQRLIDILSDRLSADVKEVFSAGIGAAVIRELLASIDLDELCRELRSEICATRAPKQRAVLIRRLLVAGTFLRSGTRPEWMILEALPVLPPDLRPMVRLRGDRVATSDVNDLYRRIINRNNRLRRIMEIEAPESIVNDQHRKLQKAVDALIDKQGRAQPVCGEQTRRPLKSLSDLLKGKEGRFRKNLLGKRVDYSGRSVIVVGPELKLHQCGLPREMALELFKPFVMKKLVEKGFTTNIKTAKRMVDRVQPQVWDALEEVIEDHPVLLNRAPTLHRLGVQAFEPLLVDGQAIRLHPLVCAGFNADFDGDTMAVHVPLSSFAQAEARILMMASQNLLKPADGSFSAGMRHEATLGLYYLTMDDPER